MMTGPTAGGKRDELMLEIELAKLKLQLIKETQKMNNLPHTTENQSKPPHLSQLTPLHTATPVQVPATVYVPTVGCTAQSWNTAGVSTDSQSQSFDQWIRQVRNNRPIN
jgi:hypothetical protein